MRRVFICVFFIFFAAFYGFATGTGELGSPDELRLMVLKGPGALGLLPVIHEGRIAGVNANIIYEDNPSLALKSLEQKEADIAVLPVNLAARLYNQDKSYRMFSVYIWGVLYLVGPEPVSPSSLAGRTVFLPSRGANPDIMFLRLLESWGIADTVNVRYSDSPLELARAASESGFSDFALLPEPFVSRVLSDNTALLVAMDLQDMWAREFSAPFPQTALVVRDGFLLSYPDFFSAAEDFLAAGLLKLMSVSDFSLYTDELESIGFSPSLAHFALPRCRFSWISAYDARPAVEAYLGVLLEADASLVGGRLPDGDFYLR